MKIGGISIPVGAGLAPMAGVTDLPARLLAHEHGASFAVSEMLSAKGYIYAPDDRRAVREILMNAPHAGLCGLQLFGSDPALVREAAARLSDAGFHFIDINMGCPAHKIVSNGEGAALMRDIPAAARVVRAAVEGARLPVTVKMRSGWDPENVNAVELARAAEDSGASALTIHARTRDQMYSGRADLEVIARVKRAVRIPVIGNGDVASAGDALNMLGVTGCDSIMVGRAARGNPWIFAEIRAALTGSSYALPSIRARVSVALRHLDMAAAYMGGARALPYMRGHLPAYIAGYRGCAKLRERLNSIETLDEVREVLLEFAEEEGDGGTPGALPRDPA